MLAFCGAIHFFHLLSPEQARGSALVSLPEIGSFRAAISLGL
jgi:hypothetical protein